MTNNKGDEKAKEPKDLSPKLKSKSAEQELKDAGKATNDWIKQVKDDQYRRESLRLQRTLTFKTDKYTHALDMIIERAKYQKGSPNISIDLKELIFGDADVKTLMGWLEEIESFGGFRHYSKQNYTGGVRFYLTGLNIGKLTQYKNQMGLLPQGKGILKLPPESKWENITIQFFNGDEVLIKCGDLTRHTNYEEMGFLDKRTKSTTNKPNRQWKFLKGLSETKGEISWRSSKATLKGKKQKQLLSERLKKYFGIDSDPFYSYKNERAYKIRLTLIPEQKDSENNKGSGFDLEEVYKEQTPEVYDEHG